jgi:uncharacterized protein (TIGR02147 family)
MKPPCILRSLLSNPPFVVSSEDFKNGFLKTYGTAEGTVSDVTKLPKGAVIMRLRKTSFEIDSFARWLLIMRMPENEVSYRLFLIEEFKRRKMRNSAYSLRAYSRDLQVSVARLSEILNSKAGLSVKSATKMTESLPWSADKKALFIDLVTSQHHRSALARRLATERLFQRQSEPKQISSDDFLTLSEWYYAPLVELLYTKPTSYEAAHLGSLLGLDEVTTMEALLKLQALQLIQWQDQELVPTDFRRVTPRGGASASAARKIHKQLLKKTETAIDEQPFEKRIVSSVVMAIDPDQMAVIQEKIRQFQMELLKEMEKAPGKTAVYCMATNFFEMTVPKPGVTP